MAHAKPNNCGSNVNNFNVMAEQPMAGLEELLYIFYICILRAHSRTLINSQLSTFGFKGLVLKVWGSGFGVRFQNFSFRSKMQKILVMY